MFRGVAQLVARTAGGREVAGSSPVTPTIDLHLGLYIKRQLVRAAFWVGLAYEPVGAFRPQVQPSTAILTNWIIEVNV